MIAMLETFSDKPTVDGHRPHIHLGTGGVGLFVVNALSERLTVSTVRDGDETTTGYARGEVTHAILSTPTNLASGTTVRFRPDPTIFPHPSVPRAELTSVLEDLSFLTPRLTLSWSMTGDEVIRAGLVGHVALRAGRELSDVASHRESHPTANGPVDVDIAVAWRGENPGFGAPAPIYSYVNLGRTRGDGSHVDGCSMLSARSSVGAAGRQTRSGWSPRSP